MYIYKITNTINGKWYIGKHSGTDPNYMGSGKILKQAYAKHGHSNFNKEILETCSTEAELNIRESYWISKTNATTDPMSYNLVDGGTGGDRSKLINYKTRNLSNNTMQGTRDWFNTLSDEEKKEFHASQAAKRTKGWYVSTVTDPTEVYVQNISKWCEEHNVDKSMPTTLNNPKSHLFQKQTKGWRIRRSDMPGLLPYENRRHIPTDNKCRGRGWKLIDGKRVWYDK